MGSDKSECLNKDEKMICVRTAELKERLNRVYARFHARTDGLSNLGHFDHLWDLKELALIERRHSLEVPETWLKELETDINDLDLSSHYSH